MDKVVLLFFLVSSVYVSGVYLTQLGDKVLPAFGNGIQPLLDVNASAASDLANNRAEVLTLVQKIIGNATEPLNDYFSELKGIYGSTNLSANTLENRYVGQYPGTLAAFGYFVSGLSHGRNGNYPTAQTYANKLSTKISPTVYDAIVQAIQGIIDSIGVPEDQPASLIGALEKLTTDLYFNHSATPETVNLQVSAISNVILAVDTLAKALQMAVSEVSPSTTHSVIRLAGTLPGFLRISTEISTLPVTTEKSTLPATTEKSTIPATSEKSTIPVTTEKWTLPATSEKSTIPVTSEKSTIPVTSEKSTIPVTSEKSTIPVTSEKSTIPVTTEKSTIPVTSEKSTIPVTSEKSTIPVTTEKSTIPVTSEKSTIPVTSEKSTIPASTSMPEVIHPDVSSRVPNTTAAVIAKFNAAADKTQASVTQFTKSIVITITFVFKPVTSNPYNWNNGNTVTLSNLLTNLGSRLQTSFTKSVNYGISQTKANVATYVNNYVNDQLDIYNQLYRNFQTLWNGLGRSNSIFTNSCVTRYSATLLAQVSSLQRLDPCVELEIGSLGVLESHAKEAINKLKDDVMKSLKQLQLCRDPNGPCAKKIFASFDSQYQRADATMTLIENYISASLTGIESRVTACTNGLGSEIESQAQTIQDDFNACLLYGLQ